MTFDEAREIVFGCSGAFSSMVKVRDTANFGGFSVCCGTKLATKVKAEYVKKHRVATHSPNAYPGYDVETIEKDTCMVGVFKNEYPKFKIPEGRQGLRIHDKDIGTLNIMWFDQ